ncbi:aldose 1-epimerase family protein [Komagataeibacter melaceti]|uniref:Aldose 1-epimerase family protein n=1 Tax=Komagataeibacter melaceti TaxID=2766577 RepID=A0A371Z2U9_9PROT|nr:aldose 1-epimerase family protein [Komagataeibacter melaceti]RFD20830.1 aldose 1-epimerase family protein [Komagataeibacter melaceti]
MTEDIHTFGDGRLGVSVRLHGAELCGLRADGRDLLWGGHEPWRRQAPVLFPIVGRLVDDTARIDGQNYHMTQHGFARDSEFRWIASDETGCRLELVDTPQTRQMFPFAFSLVIEYRVAEGRLTVDYCVTNPDATRVLPASLGAHPAFVWPLAPSVAKDRHVIEFDQPEPENVRRLNGGLLLPESFPTPITGRVLHLDESLFAQDALILDRPRSRGVTYRIPDGPGLRLTWEGFAQLGIWMKPGGDFICIEPWYGLASPVGFTGEFSTRPGVFHLQPGQEWRASWQVGCI